MHAIGAESSAYARTHAKFNTNFRVAFGLASAFAAAFCLFFADGLSVRVRPHGMWKSNRACTVWCPGNPIATGFATRQPIRPGMIFS